MWTFIGSRQGSASNQATEAAHKREKLQRETKNAGADTVKEL